MKFGGIQKLTLIDYPGKIATTLFVYGCNFKCRFCYNSDLVLSNPNTNKSFLSEEEIFSFLEERKGFLEGVVLCGGEPTIYPDLPDFTEKIKQMGYKVKLDTNGSNPEMLHYLIKKKLIDYVAMDIKAPKDKYPKVVQCKVSIEKIEKSITLLKESNLDYEFRTTVVPTLLEKDDIIQIAKWLKGAKKYVLQQFQPGNTVDPSFSNIKPYPEEYLVSIHQSIAFYFQSCEIRL